MRERALRVLRDWAEPLAYGAVALTILWLLDNMALLGGPAGWLVLGVAAFVLWRLFRGAYVEGMLKRARAEGPGVVDIVERRIAYFGPEQGGGVSIDALTRVEIHTTSDGPLAEDVFWVFHVEGQPGPVLTIPAGAVGAERLLGALSALPGFDHDGVVRAMGSTADAVFIIWRRRAGAEPWLPGATGAA